MIAFNSNDPFPLIDAASHSYTETLEHAEKVDAWLGLQVGTVEEYLAKHGCRSRAHHHSHDPQQLWIGLAPRSLLTPYTEIRSFLERLNPKAGSTIVDLGAGFGRMGFVVARHFPLVNFIGYEYVGERVKEGRRCFNLFSKKLSNQMRDKEHGEVHVTFEHTDLSDPTFAPASAEYYFIYDFGSRKALEKSLHDLRRIAANRSITVVGRGRHSRDLIEHGHPWLSGVGPVEHRGTNSIYTTVHADPPSY